VLREPHPRERRAPSPGLSRERPAHAGGHRAEARRAAPRGRRAGRGRRKRRAAVGRRRRIWGGGGKVGDMGGEGCGPISIIE
jgi:hypothetical protein